MKPIKVLWNGKLLREIYPHATRWQVFKFKVKRFFRKVFIASGIVIASYSLFILGGALNPKINYIQAETPKEIIPVLERIAKCESGSKQFDKNGQVLMRSNTNRSVDVGKYQINTVWFAKATELGYDLTTEKGNIAMAEWIYANRGTGDWSSSSNCWKK